MTGWIKLHRSVLDHWISQEPEGLAVFTRLLLEANHSPRKAMFNGSLVEVGRGQLIFGREAFSAKSGVSVSKLRRYMKLLTEDGTISQQNASKFTLISITNYDSYQGIDQQNTSTSPAGDQQNTSKPPASDHTIRIKEGEEGKNGKNEKKQSSFAADVRAIFDYWLERMGKTASTKLTDKRKRAVTARLKQGYSVDDIKQGIDGCASSPFHMGQNDQGTVYDDLELICRNGEKLENFMQNIGKVIPKRPGHEPETIDDFTQKSQARSQRILDSGLLDDLD